jgi:hypothetical protein
MVLEISKKGNKHKGHTTEISPVDRDLAKFRWSLAKTSPGHQYAAHHTNQVTSLYFGVEVGKTVYLHRVILARKQNIAYADLEVITGHKDGDGLNNCRRNIRKAQKRYGR